MSGGAPEVSSKDAGVKGKAGERNEQQDGGNLDDHDDRVEDRSALDAADDQEGDAPQDKRHNNDADDGGLPVAGSENTPGRIVPRQ